jgi:hypothetical protein
MKKLVAASHRRPAGALRRIPRTRTETAVELVRAEFEGARLEREIAQADARKAVSARALSIARNRAARLLARLADKETPQ